MINHAANPPSASPRGSSRRSIGRQATDETWQPERLVELLSPDFRDAYRKLPAPIALRIADLVRRVPRILKIAPDRLVGYALLAVAAERESAAMDISREHAVRARAELIGQQHGLETGYEQPKEAGRLRGRSRQARQRIEASLSGVMTAWERAEHVIRRERSHLPIHLRDIVSDGALKRIPSSLVECQSVLRLLPKGSATDDRVRKRTHAAYTYLLWMTFVPRYRGKWHHMHNLALRWRLTEADSVEAFRQIVHKTHQTDRLNIPLLTAWIHLLSLKS